MSMLAAALTLILISVPGYVAGSVYSKDRLDRLICGLGLSPAFAILYGFIPLWFGIHNGVFVLALAVFSLALIVRLLRSLKAGAIRVGPAMTWSRPELALLVVLGLAFLIPAAGIPYSHLWNETWVADEDLVFHVISAGSSYRAFFTDITRVSEAVATSYYPPVRLCLLYIFRLFHNSYGYSAFGVLLPAYSWALWILISVRMGTLLRNKRFALFMVLLAGISPGLMEVMSVEWGQDVFLMPTIYFVFYHIFLYLREKKGSCLFMAFLGTLAVGWSRVYAAGPLLLLLGLLTFRGLHVKKKINVRLWSYFAAFALLSVAWPMICWHYHRTPFYPQQGSILCLNLVHPDAYIRYIFFRKYFWPGSLPYKLFLYFVSNYYFNSLTVVALAYAVMRPIRRRHPGAPTIFRVWALAFIAMNVLLLLVIDVRRVSPKFIFPLTAPILIVTAFFLTDLLDRVKVGEGILAEKLYRVSVGTLGLGVILNIVIFGGGKLALNYNILGKLNFSHSPSPAIYGKTNLEIARRARAVVEKEGRESVLLFLTADYQGTFGGLLAGPGTPIWAFNYDTSFDNEALHRFRDSTDLMAWLREKGVRYIVSWADEADFRKYYFRTFVDDEHPGVLARLITSGGKEFSRLMAEDKHFRKFALYRVNE